MIGKSLGPYKILEALGAGGMGEVYLAKDSRLGRNVAIKVLPAEFASDPERLARFEQEARAAAALNHPHIAVVHDIGSATDADGTTTHFMVQEHLKGESLRERLDRAVLSLPEALALATEVGEALVAAHKAGIIHRDLKPDNIFVTEQGHAKVLDFGLAKLMEITGPGPGQASMSPTMLGTVAGQVMGTAGYMAPEQINGETVDGRADLFAFGCVLYNMVTGKQAFAGSNVHETLGRILSAEPQSIAEIDDSLPTELQRIIRKALAKAAANRYQTAGDLVIDLRTLGSDVDSGATQPLSGAVPVMSAPAPPAAGMPWKLALPLALLAIVLTTATTLWLTSSSPIPEPVRRFEIPFPPETNFESAFTLGVALSPSGTHLVFNAGRRLWMRQIDDFVAEEIRGTADARVPFFSPDGQQLGFWQDDQIKRVAIAGGAAVALGPAPTRAHGAHWGEDGFVYYGQGAEGILRLSANGGEPETIVATEDGQLAGSPHLLPGGEWLLFALSTGNWDDGEIQLLSLATGERKTLINGGRDARYVPTGHIVYGLTGNLLAIPFDLGTGEVSGGPVPLVEGVRSSGNGSMQYSLSQRGGLAYFPGTADQGTYQLTWVDRSGAMQPLPLDPRASGRMTLSPGADRVAVEVQGDGGWDLWVLEVERGGQLRLTTDGSSRSPLFSPDGEWVYFGRGDAGNSDIWRQRSDRSQPAEPVLEAEGQQRPRAISQDGKWLAYDQGAIGGRDIGLLGLTEESEPRLIVASEADDAVPALSPDGRFIVYFSNESGLYAVYVKEIATGRVWAVSTGTGGTAAWSADGSEIFFIVGAISSSIWGAAVTFEPEFSVSEPYELFDVQRRAFSNYAVLDGGQRFLFTVQANTADITSDAGPQISLVLNWFEELRTRVPTGR